MLNGFSFGAGGRAATLFDMTTLDLSGYWRPDFTGVPWVGTTTAGTSGGLELDNGGNSPTTGTAVNGYTPPDFNGSNQSLIATTLPTMTDYITTSIYSYFVVFNADTAPSDFGGSSAPYSNAALFASTSGGMGLAFSTSGVSAWHFDNSNYNTIQVAASAGAFHLAIVVYDGTDLTTYVDSLSGSAQSRSNVGVSVLSYTMFVGKNYNASQYFDGRILEFGLSKNAFSASERLNIKGYVNGKYGLSL